MSAVTNSPPERNKQALVIGNSQYHYVSPLQNPSNDAHDLCKSLSELGYQTHCFIDVRTRAELKSLIEDYIEALPNDSVSVIFYAGHAVQIAGANYLIPTGANIQDAHSILKESVSRKFLMAQPRQSQPFLNMIILDACRNNPLQSTVLPQGLAQITDVPDSTVVFYATAEEDVAMDGVGRNGILTKNLLAHLKDDGSIDDLFNRVSLGVQADTTALGHRQTPALSKNFADQYFLVKPTELEKLVKRQQEAEQTISGLEARVSAGDKSASAQLADMRATNQKLLDQIRLKDEESKKAEKAEKAARERQRKSELPPSP